jgi:hypothetical protein
VHLGLILPNFGQDSKKLYAVVAALFVHTAA